MLRLAVLLSGGGTTLQNLIDQIAAGRLAAQITQVIASKPGVMGIERARRAGLPIEVLLRRDYPSTEAYSEAIYALCESSKAELICMAGFLQHLWIPPAYEGRIMNIHPALLPAFGGPGMYGHHIHEAVLQYGVKVSGCTVHFANNRYDEGPIIVQRVVPVLENDSVDTLAARVFEQECIAYPEAIRLYAEGRLRIVGRRVFLDAVQG